MINEYKRLVSLSNSYLSDPERPFSSLKLLWDCVEYSLCSSGKRVRPVITLAVSKMLGVEMSRVRTFCIALECIHAFSLVHDDLPCMDNDEQRRGQPTSHVKFGETTALLAGDRLFAYAFSVLSQTENEKPALVLELVKLLSKATEDLCDGQMMDLVAIGKVKTEQSGSFSKEQELRERHLKKTAALIKAAAQAPCYFLPALEQESNLSSLASFGENLGLLFQVTDDILDAEDEVVEAESCVSYVSYYGISGAKTIAKDLCETAKNNIAYFKNNEFLLWFCDYVLERDR